MTLDQRVSGVYEELRMDVYRYVLTIGLPPFAAQDITQDAFVRFYETLYRGGAIENARAWLLRVAHNLTVNAVTAMSSRTVELTDAVRGAGVTAEERLIQEERRTRLHDEISRLSSQQRACLELRAQGLRYREIADILGISTSTAGEYIKRAVSRLRETLHE